MKTHSEQKQNIAIKPFVEFESMDENILRFKDNLYFTSIFMKFGKKSSEEKEKMGQ